VKIPTTFQLGGTTWEVVQNMPVPNALGACFSQEAQVLLQKDLKKQIKEQTFCHELTHAILFAMGKTDHDEQFVDAFGTFLHQYMNSAK
jgi:hypothetical protein